jgi:hypothetical protein
LRHTTSFPLNPSLTFKSNFITLDTYRRARQEDQEGEEGRNATHPDSWFEEKKNKWERELRMEEIGIQIDKEATAVSYLLFYLLFSWR